MPLSGVGLPQEVKMIDNDLQTFTMTSDKSYDRHKYKIVLKNGKSVTVEDYDVMRYMWNQWANDVETVIVEDASGQGF